jgi:multiphosphoryl transfer protein
MVLVDGSSGEIIVDPSDAELASVGHLEEEAVHSGGAGRTADGHPIALLANVATPDTVTAAARAGAEGIGLFRTEFCFLDRLEAPSIDEQIAAYRRVFDAFAGRKVTIRTLDAGSDKPLPFVTAPNEPNPALGVRGYRTSADHPEVLDAQLAAIEAAAAVSDAEVWVMAPMVATPEEAAEFASRCHEHNLSTVGVMVETPSAALMAGEILAHVDFISLGTNDLAQYTMAADRTLGAVARMNDPFQPAVLRMIRIACDGAAAAGKPVGLCGEAAADPALATVLVGLGVSSLSMTPRALGPVRSALAGVSLSRCRELAEQACGARTAEAARAVVLASR